MEIGIGISISLPQAAGSAGGGLPPNARLTEDAAGVSTGPRYEEDGVTVRETE